MALRNLSTPPRLIVMNRLWHQIREHLRDYLDKLGLPMAVLIASTAIGMSLNPWHHEGYAALVFVAGMSVIGAISGLYIALVCAISGALAFNYFVADPVYQINYQRPYDFIPPVVFIVCAGLSAIISGRARDEASAAHAARTQLEELLDISRRFQGADTLESIRDVLIAELNRRGPDCLLYWQDDAGLQRSAGDHDTPDEAMHVMARVADPATPAPGLYIQPLHAGDGCIGALACRTAGGAAQEPGGDAKVLIEGLARLANLALARVHLANALTEQRARARVDQLQSALLMAFSHDLRTPLTAISTAAASLSAFADTIDPQTRQDLTDTIEQECDRLNRLTANLMQLTRLEAGDGVLHAAPIAVDDMLRHCLRRIEREAGPRRITAALRAEGASVRTEIALFELAIANILQNAIKFSPADSTITVTSSIVGNRGVIAISDQGNGVPADEQAMVFQRFHRAVDRRTGPPGSGLGLAIARGFVEAAGGTIGLASPGIEGCGTTVTIELPLAELGGLE